MMTPEQYEESLEKLNLSVYMFGREGHRHPGCRPHHSAIAQCRGQDLRDGPSAGVRRDHDRYVASLRQADQPLHPHFPEHARPGAQVQNGPPARIAHTGCCFQRCVGMDALNTLSIITPRHRSGRKAPSTTDGFSISSRASRKMIWCATAP